jgi:hypothetical protein
MVLDIPSTFQIESCSRGFLIVPAGSAQMHVQFCQPQSQREQQLGIFENSCTNATSRQQGNPRIFAAQQKVFIFVIREYIHDYALRCSNSWRRRLVHAPSPEASPIYEGVAVFCPV